MKAVSLKLHNYKSLGEVKNELVIASGITVIIGKNESGKSNLIEGAGELDFFRHPYSIEHADRKLNRASGSKRLCVTLRLKEYGRANRGRFTEIVALKDSITISGAHLEEMKADEKLTSLLSNSRLLSVFEKEKLDYFEEYSSSPYKLLQRLESIVEIAQEKYPFCYKELCTIGEITKSYAYKLPYILVNDKDEKNKFFEFYFLDDIDKLDEDDIFVKLLRLANDKDGFSPNLIIKNLTASQSARELFNQGLDEIALKYSAFSGTNLALKYKIEDDRFYLLAKIDNRCLTLDEMSICDKWLFSLFIDILWRKVKNRNIIFVFDQPGLYMHVNAQKELLRIFDSIAQRGHQIIYTTHSPFLLDIDDMSGIRAVEKHGGRTSIYNKIYAGELTKGAKIETISPILEALGCGMPKYQNGIYERLNLIVEGISDYYYIKAMLAFLSTKKISPYVLPSVGASNIANVASILIGWGQAFKAIVDHDEEGKKAAEKMQHCLGLVMGKDIVYVNGSKSFAANTLCRIENLISPIDFKKIRTSSGANTKALLSKEFYDLVLTKKLTPSLDTIKNFSKLFNALGI